MKKTLTILIALVLLFGCLCPVMAESELPSGTYELTSYEAGSMRMEASMMPDTYFIVNGDGTGTFCVQSVSTSVTYDAGTIYVGGEPTYSYVITGARNIQINMFDILLLNMERTSASTAVSEAAAASAPSDSGIRIDFGGYSDAKYIIVYRASSGGRGANWTQIADLNVRAIAFTDDTPMSGTNYYKFRVTHTDGTISEYYYRNSDLQEEWELNSKDQIQSGHDYVGGFSYTYVYENGVFKYRKKTILNLQNTGYYTYDQTSTKIGTATTYAITLKEKAVNCCAIGFNFQITQIESGRPFGVWRLYARLAGKKNGWREVGTFTVENGDMVTKNIKIKNPMTIDRIAFIGPRASYSISTSKVVTSITLKDMDYE